METYRVTLINLTLAIVACCYGNASFIMPYQEVPVADDEDTAPHESKSHDNMDDIVKALTDFSVDDETATADLEEGNDIIKALTDLSTTDNADVTPLDDDNTLPTTAANQSNVVTISYTQVSIVY